MKVDLQQLQDKFKEKKRTLDFEINELNKKLKNQADNEASKQ
jgi:hypothetical protein